MSEDTVMKHKRYIFLLIAAVAFIIQLIDIISYTIKFSITQTFVLVIIQMIGLVGYAYGARNVVKNKRRMFYILHSIAFIIYLINLTYQLFLNPALRHVKVISSVNISPLKTIFLYYTTYTRHTLPIKNIILNMIGNVMLFMPFGYFVYVLFKPMRSFQPYFFFFLFMIVGVEVIQYIWKVGSADIDDIILNMSGVLILYIVLKIPFIKKLF